MPAMSMGTNADWSLISGSETAWQTGDASAQPALKREGGPSSFEAGCWPPCRTTSPVKRAVLCRR